MFRIQMTWLIYILDSTHAFDCDERKKTNPKRKGGTISQYGVPGRGAEGVRSYHKSNDEKILAHRRLSLPDNGLFQNSF